MEDLLTFMCVTWISLLYPDNILLNENLASQVLRTGTTCCLTVLISYNVGFFIFVQSQALESSPQFWPGVFPHVARPTCALLCWKPFLTSWMCLELWGTLLFLPLLFLFSLVGNTFQEGIFMTHKYFYKVLLNIHQATSIYIASTHIFDIICC